MGKNLPAIIFLTGASGVGKTTILHKLRAEITDSSISCLHFDSIGVPSQSEMVRDYGSGSEWQKVMTQQWLKNIKENYQNKKLIILEGQVNLDYIIAACENFEINQYKIVLAHCEKAIRHGRLRERNQPELINTAMDTWAEFLNAQAINKQAIILNTTLMNTDQMLNQFKKIIHWNNFS